MPITFTLEERNQVKSTEKLLRLIQFSDSMLPVGTFSFSCGLETASHTGAVTDAATLQAYTYAVVRQAAFTDGIAALHAFRAVQKEEDYAKVLHSDEWLMASKMNDEARMMLLRMGRKLAELSVRIMHAPILKRWLNSIMNGETFGTYPVSQAVTFHAAGLSENDLFCSQLYGTANMILSAALRCVRVSHYETQRILFGLAEEAPRLYNEITLCTLEDMNAFVPQTDLMASLHEKGNMRMFMN